MARKPFVSVCMIVRDEERAIGRALDSVRGLADEVVVVDTGSTDDTVAIARSRRARVSHFPWCDDFAAARNAAIAHARGEWVVTMDADEYFPPQSAARLRWCMEHAKPEVMALMYRVVNVEAEGARVIDRVSVVRAFRNRPYHRYVGAIHEQLKPHGAVVQLPDVEFLHDGYDPVVTEARDKLARNRKMLHAMLDAMGPEDSERHYVEMQLAVEYAREERPEAAAEYVLQAAGGLRGFAALHNRAALALICRIAARMLTQVGRNAELLALAREAAALDPLLPEAYFARGWASINLGAVNQGVADLLWAAALIREGRQAAQLSSPHDERIVWTLASQALAERGAPEAAATVLVHALAAIEDPDLLRRAFSLARQSPAAAGVLVRRLPTPRLREMTQFAAQVGHAALLRLCAARLTELNDAYAEVALALLALARGARAEAAEILGRVSPADAAAYAAARFALERLDGDGGGAAPKAQGKEVVVA